MPKLLIIGYVWPEPDSSAAGSRMMQLIRFFQEDGYSICFATTAQKSAFSADLKGLGIRTEAIALNDESFDIFIREYRPEVVLFDRFMMEEQFGWRVAENCPEAVRILDTEDLHFLRKARQAAVKQNLPLTPALLQSDTAKREIASIYRCDLSLIISQKEMQLLREEFSIAEALLFYLPLTERSVSLSKKELPDFEQRTHFVSIGNFLHEPNWDAILYLKQEIWPLIREQLPQAQIHIYGAYPSQKVFQLNNPKEGFVVKGRADSASGVLQRARVLLAPLRFGAGIKGKFLDAMKAGTPSVTTSTGAEGMMGGKSWGGAIEDDPKAFSKAAVEMYSNFRFWGEAQKTGFELLGHKFLEDDFKKDFLARLAQLNATLQVHREQNFMGSLLSHHQLQSTRYLAKYIEMKNRLQALLLEKDGAVK